MTYGKIIFKQINKLEFLVTGEIDKLLEYIEDILKQISNNQLHLFIEPTNDNLRQSILARVLALEFFKEHELPSDILVYRLVLHDSKQDRDLYVSVGKIQDPTDLKEPAKIAESYFIK